MQSGSVQGVSVQPGLDNRGERQRPKSFLDGLRLDHGPIADIGRFLLAAEAMVRSHGITLSFARTSELRELQENNAKSWPLLAPWMNAKFAALDDDNSYCLLGRNAAGQLVASQGGRIYRLGDRSLKTIVDDHSLIYGRPTLPQGNDPYVTLTAPIAAHLTGTIVYSGALWVAPEHRGNRLAALLPRISRAYALGKFGTETTFCVVSDQIAESPLFAMYGYTLREPGFSLWEGDKKFYTASLLWMPESQLVADMNATRERLVAQVDGAVGSRGRNDELRAVS
jgi:hypothetical protein